MTTTPLSEAVERLTDMAACLADTRVDGSGTLLAASVAIEHAADLRTVLAALSPPAGALREAWADIPSGKRFGRRLTEDAVEHLMPGTLLRFHSESPWFEHRDGMPGYGEIVAFTGAVCNAFPRVGPHLEVMTLDGRTYAGGGWVYGLFQFVSDPPANLAALQPTPKPEGDTRN